MIYGFADAADGGVRKANAEDRLRVSSCSSSVFIGEAFAFAVRTGAPAPTAVPHMTHARASFLVARRIACSALEQRRTHKNNHARIADGYTKDSVGAAKSRTCGSPGTFNISVIGPRFCLPGSPEGALIEGEEIIVPVSICVRLQKRSPAPPG